MKSEQINPEKKSGTKNFRCGKTVLKNHFHLQRLQIIGVRQKIYFLPAC